MRFLNESPMLLECTTLHVVVIQIYRFAIIINQLACLFANAIGFLENLIGLCKLEVEIVKFVQLKLRDVSQADDLLLGFLAIINDVHAFLLVLTIVNESLESLLIN